MCDAKSTNNTVVRPVCECEQKCVLQIRRNLPNSISENSRKSWEFQLFSEACWLHNVDCLFIFNGFGVHLNYECAGNFLAKCRLQCSLYSSITRSWTAEAFALSNLNFARGTDHGSSFHSSFTMREHLPFLHNSCSLFTSFQNLASENQFSIEGRRFPGLPDGSAEKNNPWWLDFDPWTHSVDGETQIDSYRFFSDRHTNTWIHPHT